MIREEQREALQSIFAIAQIHAKRLKYAMEKIRASFPLSAASVTAISDEQIPVFELYTSRFAKLQDLMGKTLFPKLLDVVGDLTNDMTYLDKLNKLEQLKIIDSSEIWMEMRDIRNHLSHEYPDQPELTAEHLNDAFISGKKLLDCLNRAIQFAQHIL